MPNPLSSAKTKYFLRCIMKHQLQDPCLQVDKEYFGWIIDIVIYLNYCKSKSVLTFCGNKIPTRCNRGFYCRSYCLLNMFRASSCPSSGAQEYYTVVAVCGISCCGFQVAGLV